LSNEETGFLFDRFASTGFILLKLGTDSFLLSSAI
jgi:hypothetical protein